MLDQVEQVTVPRCDLVLLEGFLGESHTRGSGLRLKTLDRVAPHVQFGYLKISFSREHAELGLDHGVKLLTHFAHRPFNLPKVTRTPGT